MKLSISSLFFGLILTSQIIYIFMYYNLLPSYSPLFKDLGLFCLFIISIAGIRVEQFYLNTAQVFFLAYFSLVFLIGIFDYDNLTGLLLSFREFLFIPALAFCIGIVCQSQEKNTSSIEKKLQITLCIFSILLVLFSFFKGELFSIGRVSSYLNDQHMPGIISSVYVCINFFKGIKVFSFHLLSGYSTFFLLLYSLKTGSRIVLAIYISAIAIYFLKNMSLKLKIPIKQFFVCFCLFILSFAVILIGENLWTLLGTGRNLNYNIATRINYYEWALNNIVNNPLWGIKIDTFQSLNIFSKSVFISNGFETTTLDSSFLKLMVTTGIFPFCLLALGTLLTLKSPVNLKFLISKILIYAAILSGFVTGKFFTFPLNWLVFFLVGYLSANIQKRSPRSQIS